MAPHSSTLAWKIPWMEEPGRPQSMRSPRVGHGWATSLSLFTFMHWRRKGQPTQCSCLENPRDGRAWWAAIYGVAQGRTRLKRLSSSSSSMVLLCLTCWRTVKLARYKCSNFSKCSPTFIIFFLFDCSHAHSYEAILLHSGFDLHLPMVAEVDLLMCLGQFYIYLTHYVLIQHNPY